jgi:hypothetical protein
MKSKIISFQYTALVQSLEVIPLATVSRLSWLYRNQYCGTIFRNELLQGIQTYVFRVPVKNSDVIKVIFISSSN